MSTEIYKATLEKLAASGNQEAQAALAQVKSIDREMIISKVRAANEELQEALRHNDYSWTGKTDMAIKRAQNILMDLVSRV